MANLETSPDANCDRQTDRRTDRRTDRMTKPLIGAQATALPKKKVSYAELYIKKLQSIMIIKFSADLL